MARPRESGLFEHEAPYSFIVGCLQHGALRMVPSGRVSARSAALRAGYLASGYRPIAPSFGA